MRSVLDIPRTQGHKMYHNEQRQMKFDLLRRKQNEMFDTFSCITWHVTGICSHSNMTSEITTM